jgi:hypothetical protein
MSIPVPNLDDRNWADLVQAAQDYIRSSDPLWTDLSPSDPGIVLVDAFAHLTDILLYRLNRVPDRIYAVFLNLLGTQLRPPTFATVQLQFTRTDATNPLTAPQGLRVTVARPDSAGAPVFVTTTPVTFPAGTTTATALAIHADTYIAVVLGTGTGLPGQTVTLPNVPAVQGAVRIAVELGPNDPTTGGAVVDGQQFGDWQEVETFADAGDGDRVFVVDRVTGIVTFAPAVDSGTGPPQPIAAVPGTGLQIRGWWQSGGGALGNVAAGTLTVLRDPLPGVTVANPDPATGGRDTETVADAVIRAPQDFYTRQRAVTAGDYELLAAKSSGAVQRARAYNRSSIWSFAQPGEVEVVLVAAAGAVPPNGGTETIRQQVLQYLQERAPLGVSCIVSWVSYKTVGVHAHIVVRSEEDPDAVRARVEAGLNDTISGAPSSSPADAEAGFGATLRLSNLYRPLQQEEPGVLYVDQVWFMLDEVPNANVGPLAPDGYQPDCWFAGAGPVLFRTLNRGDGWEPSGEFTGEVVWTVAPYPPPPTGRPGAMSRPGWVAVGTRVDSRSRLYVTSDLGGNWDLIADVGWGISDLAWVERTGEPVLLMAGTAGMYEMPPVPNATPVQVVVDPSQADLGYYAVNSFLDYRGRAGVVVAAEGSSGVWLSDQAGTSNTFFTIRSPGDDIRALAMQYDGPVTYVWSARAVSNVTDTGCVRLRIDDLTQIDHTAVLTAWETLDAGWSAGSCWGLSFGGTEAFAASQTGGVMRMDLSASSLAWQGLSIDCGLPRRDNPPGLQPVQSVAATADGKVVLAAGDAGVYRSDDGGTDYQSVSQQVATDFVTLPPTWLFRAGQHQIEVDVAPPES